MDKKQGVTLDEVANMMGVGFAELNGRMDNFEKRMDTLEEKIDIVNANVKSLSFDYQSLLARVRDLEVKTFGSVRE